MRPIQRAFRGQEYCKPSKIICSLLACFQILLTSWGAQPTVTKLKPRPDQGSISASGKFTPALPPSTNDTAPQSAAEAEAALRKALLVTQTGSNTFQIGKVSFDKAKRIVSVPARVCIRTQIVEYALVTQTGKAYESIFTTEASPTDVHLAFVLLGVSQVPVGGELRNAVSVPETNALEVEVAWEAQGHPSQVPLSKLIGLTPKNPGATPQSLAVNKWLYNGSVFDRWGFAAQREGSIVALIRDPSALVNNPAADRDNDNLHQPNANLLPAEGTPVLVSMHLAGPPPPPAAKPPPWASPVTPLSTNYPPKQTP